MGTAKKNSKPHRVSFSGNSALYSKRLVKKYCDVAAVSEASAKFAHIDVVQFNNNHTVSIAHYGRFTPHVKLELSIIGKTLYDSNELIAFGFDYDSKTPLLLVLSPKRLYIIPYKINLYESTNLKYPQKIDEIAGQLQVQEKTESIWTNRTRNNPQNIPPLINAIDPYNEGFDFE